MELYFEYAYLRRLIQLRYDTIPQGDSMRLGYPPQDPVWPEIIHSMNHNFKHLGREIKKQCQKIRDMNGGEMFIPPQYVVTTDPLTLRLFMKEVNNGMD